MASFPAQAVLFVTMVLVLQPWYATSNIFSPIIDNLVCDMMECGKGKCKPSHNSTLGFVCECFQGWKNPTIPHFDEELKFLPCLIPNCTFNSNCIKEEFSFPPQTAEKPTASNFNPCHWTDCGGGTCNKISLFKYRCECQEGYNNMFKVPLFPCYKECAFENDCSIFGVNTSKTLNSPDSSWATKTPHQGLVKALQILGMLVVIL